MTADRPRVVLGVGGGIAAYKVAEEELAAEAEFDVVLVNSDVRTVARDLLTLVVGSPTERVPSEP
jgi:guanylate kinase